MTGDLLIYNTLTRQKEKFQPLNPPFVGMYVCGPTVYSNAHLGNCRTFISFDLMFRYLLELGYKVRYVRNITDVGHLEDENAGEGEDRVGKKARLEQLEPMEIVQRYTNGFHEVMTLFNALPPSIEPSASGHVEEQIEMTKGIIENGFAYEHDGSIYFDVEKYAATNNYGILSGRTLDDQLSNTRELEGQEEKKGRLDFALWKKAKPEHLMRWNSPWGKGFPGWHIECSAMSRKYLGETFDIHGGGMDLIPTHHTNEIAQSVGCTHKAPVNYWIHTNMLMVNGQKMSKSLNNSILPIELLTGLRVAADCVDASPSVARLDGPHNIITRPYSPMTVRFFMMQTHYSSALNITDEALQASEKGFLKLMAAVRDLGKMKTSGTSTSDIAALEKSCYAAMNDDFNSPILVAHLFEGVRIVNSVIGGTETITAADAALMKSIFDRFVFKVLGLKDDRMEGNSGSITEGLMQLIIRMRAEARAKKDFATSDLVRDELGKLNIILKDSKDGTSWGFKE